MGIRTTVTLEQDVIDRVKDESKATGRSFGETLNELVRDALAHKQSMTQRKRELRIHPIRLARLPEGVTYDCTERLLEYLDGPGHK